MPSILKELVEKSMYFQLLGIKVVVSFMGSCYEYVLKNYISAK